MKTAMNDEMIDSETTLVVHRVDSVSDRRQDRKRERELSRDRKRRDREREREQTAMFEET
jgi:hypothetical protein